MNETRPSFHETFMNVARIMSKRGTCSRLRVGAVVALDNQIVSTGYNGAPSGMVHCDHTLTSPTGNIMLEDAAQANFALRVNNSCEQVVHAEVNALLRAGASAKGAYLYTTHYPCRRCWAVIKNAGVSAVVYSELYGEIQHDYEKVVSSAQVVYDDPKFFRLVWRGAARGQR